MTDKELLKMACIELVKKGCSENVILTIRDRLRNPPRPLSDQPLVDAIVAHEEESRGRFHLSTYSFVAGIRFAERRMGIAIEDESNDG